MSATALSCFSGIGGLDLGLEAAGFENVGCLEIDDDARAALAANRPTWRLLDPSNVIDAADSLTPKGLGLAPRELTLIAGGPPCQPFSKAAQWSAPKKGIKDDRGLAAQGMLDLVEAFLPEAVMMENVAGFLGGSNNAAPMIQRAFARINDVHGTSYTLGNWVVDAADYGVPQHRKRAIVLAFRDGLDLPDRLPTTHEGRHRTAWDALGDREPQDAAPAVGKYADLLKCIPEGANYQYLTAQGAGPTHELFGYRTRFWSFLLKLAKDRPAWTLPASPGPSTGPFHWNNRPLTSWERMLLQGFPVDWKLGSNERTNVRLAGNATPPALAEVVGRYILATCDAGRPGDFDVTATLATERRVTPAPAPTPPAALPAHWALQVAAKAAHPGPGLGPASHMANQGDEPSPTRAGGVFGSRQVSSSA